MYPEGSWCDYVARSAFLYIPGSCDAKGYLRECLPAPGCYSLSPKGRIYHSPAWAHGQGSNVSLIFFAFTFLSWWKIWNLHIY